MLGGGVSGIAVARNLGRNGVPVYFVVERREEASYSRYCKKCFVVPGIQSSSSILKKFFLSSEIREKGGVIIPVTDLHTLHLSEIKGDISENFRVLVPEMKIASLLVEKRLFYKSLVDLGIPHPLTLFPKSLGDITNSEEKLKYPVFIKPSNSQVFSIKFGSKGFIVNSREELVKYLGLVYENNVEVIVQEIISGPSNNIYGVTGFFDVKHEPRALFGYHRIRSWPKGFGLSSLIESFPLRNLTVIKDFTLRYLKQIGYSGIFESEFKIDPCDGISKLIEINARSWSQNTLPTKCGINIILAAYLDSIGESASYVEEYDAGIKWINFIDDYVSARADGLSFNDWIKSLKNTKEWSIFAIDDILPWISTFYSCKRKINLVLNRTA